MFPILRQHWTLWAAWTLAASALLFANPWLPFDWAELVAAVFSLVLAIDPRTRREMLLAVGLPAIALLCVIDETGASALRLAVDWFVFTGSVLLGARAVDDQRELESIAGHLALGEDPDRASLGFRRSIEQEIARARRHERAFVLVSIAPDMRILAAAMANLSHVQKRLSEARWMLELAELMRDELHRYAEVQATPNRVLCAVPEVDDGSVDALVKRLTDVAKAQRGIDIEVGVACYPRDALGVDDLIARADEGRSSPHLESVPRERDESVVAAESSIDDAVR